MIQQCNNCDSHSGNVSELDGELLCPSCQRGVSLSNMDESDIANVYNVGDDIGAFIGVIHDRTVEWKARDGDGGFRDKSVERDAGVYVPQTVINEGTCIQNSTELLESVVQQALHVVENVQEAGYRVTGFGKNHDASLIVYIDTSDIDSRDPFITGDEFVEDTPFTGCTLMSLRNKWHENNESSPRLHLTTESKSESAPA